MRVTYLKERVEKMPNKKRCIEISDLHDNCRQFIEFWSQYMNMNEQSKYFFIQFSTFVVTEKQNVYLKTLLPTQSNAIYDVKVEFAEGDNSLITIIPYKINYLNEFNYECTQAQQINCLRNIYDQCSNFSFDHRRNNNNIIIASDLYPDFKPKSFKGKVWCRGPLTGWNDLDLEGPLIKTISLPNSTHYSLGIV